MSSLTRRLPLVYTVVKYDRRTGKRTLVFGRELIAVNISLGGRR